MHIRKLILLCLFMPVFALGCGDDEEGELSVAWSFDSGDCASNGLVEMRIILTPEGGEPQQSTFDCDQEKGIIGPYEAGSYSVVAEAQNADGVTLYRNLGQSISISDNSIDFTIDVTLRPKPSSVVVSWNGCPGSVVLPYHITLYEAPAMAGGELTTEVASGQEGCAIREHTLTNVPPGDYVVEVDSRAVTPAVLGTAPVTVVAGEDAEVMVNVP